MKKVFQYTTLLLAGMSLTACALLPTPNQDLTSKSGVNPFLIGGISVAAAAVLVILYILISKKRKENGRK